MELAKSISQTKIIKSLFKKQLRLNEGITEYNDIAFRKTSDVSIEQSNLESSEQDDSV